MKIGKIYLEKETDYSSQKEEIFIFQILSMDNINMRIKYLYPKDLIGIENLINIANSDAIELTEEEVQEVKLELL